MRTSHPKAARERNKLQQESCLFTLLLLCWFFDISRGEEDLRKKRTASVSSEFPSPSSFPPSFNRRGSLNRLRPSVIVRTRVQFHPICRYDTAKIPSRSLDPGGREEEGARNATGQGQFAPSTDRALLAAYAVQID